MQKKPSNKSSVKPPDNYREMIDTNISLTKVMLDILDTYTGVVDQQVTDQAKEKKK